MATTKKTETTATKKPAAPFGKPASTESKAKEPEVAKAESKTEEAGEKEEKKTGERAALLARENGGIAGYYGHRARETSVRFARMTEEMQKSWEGQSDDEKKAIALACDAGKRASDALQEMSTAYEKLLGCTINVLIGDPEKNIPAKKAPNFFTKSGGRRPSSYAVGDEVRFNDRNAKRFAEALGIKADAVFKVEAVLGSMYKCTVGNVQLLLEGSKIESAKAN